MAKTIDEALNELETSVTDAETRVADDETVDQQSITDLKAEVARLQAIIDGGGTLTPAQEQRFTDLRAKVDEIEKASA